MSFLPTFLMWGGIAASVPIVLHLFFRSRYRVVPWAAMDFLLKAIQETSRRLKFQELLLLLLRITVLVLLALVLALTMARITSTWAGGGSVDAVIVLDVSGSMAAKEGTKTRLELAKEAARSVVDSLPANSTVQILLASDTVRQAGPRQPSNLQQAREVIDRVEGTSRGSDLLAALQEARDAFGRVPNPNREIYLISDMQKQGLAQSSALRGVMEKLKGENTEVIAIHCGTQAPRNAAIEGIVPQTGILHTGTRASFAVLVRNTGTEQVRDLKVMLRVEGQEKGEDSRTLPVIDPGELKPVPLAVELKSGGFQVLTARIEPDDLDSDNRYDQVFRVHEQVRVLVVDGAPNPDEEDRAGSFYLKAALTPVSESTRDRYYVKTRVVTPGEATPAMLSDRDVVVLVDAPLRPRLANRGRHLSADLLDELEKFVRKGKGLMIFAGPHILPAAPENGPAPEAIEYNEELLTRRGLLPLRLGRLIPDKAEDKAGVFADAKSIQPHSFLAKFREGSLARLLGIFEVDRYVDARPTPEDREQGQVEIVLSYTNGKPALALKHVDKGKVLLCTTSADASWHSWPKIPIYLPLIHDSLSYLLQSDLQALNRRVGQPLEHVPEGRLAERSHVLKPPAPGDEVRLGKPTAEKGTPRLTYGETDRAGIYLLRAESTEDDNRVTNLERDEKRDLGVVFAVTPDLEESATLKPGTNDEVDDSLGAEGLGIKVTHLTAGQGSLTEQVTQRRAQEWTLLLALVLALLLAETVLAWYCGRTW